jgi:PleD family two-component response regulator
MLTMRLPKPIARRISVLLGVAACLAASQTPAELIKAADQALYGPRTGEEIVRTVPENKPASADNLEMATG